MWSGVWAIKPQKVVKNLHSVRSSNLLFFFVLCVYFEVVNVVKWVGLQQSPGSHPGRSSGSACLANWYHWLPHISDVSTKIIVLLGIVSMQRWRCPRQSEGIRRMSLPCRGQHVSTHVIANHGGTNTFTDHWWWWNCCIWWLKMAGTVWESPLLTIAAIGPSTTAVGSSPADVQSPMDICGWLGDVNFYRLVCIHKT